MSTPRMAKQVPATDRRRRILLVDDHPILREGFVQILNDQPDLEVCAQCETAAETLAAIPGCKPDLVIADVGLKGTNGIELIKSIRSIHEDLPVLILSMHDEALYAERALRAGAKGYVMKQSPVTDVLAAVRRVLSGERYLSRNVQDRLFQLLGGGPAPAAGSQLDLLSDRELEIFQLIGAGLGTRTIATQLHLSVKTVETHRANLKQKLGLRSGLELIRFAVDMAKQQSS